jgi:hypothetical protein
LYLVQARSAHLSLYLYHRHLFLGLVSRIDPFPALVCFLPVTVQGTLSLALPPQLYAQPQPEVLLCIEPPQLLFGRVDGHMGRHVLLRPSSASRGLLVTLDLQSLEGALVLQLGNISAQHAVHGLELGDLFVAEAASADADPKTERAETGLLDIFLSVVVLETAQAILPATDVLIICIGSGLRIFA